MRWMVDNLPLKVASLVLATLLWFVIAGEKTSELGLEVPVELRNFPPGLELLEEPPRSVEVRLRASPGLLQGLGGREVHATIDLTGVGEGERILHLSPDSIQVPFGVDVVRIAPARITLHFERTRESVVPVRPTLEGEPAEGFEVAEVLSQPATIRLAGPASRVAEVESAYTEPLSVRGATRPVTAEVAAGLEDPLLRIVGGRRVRVTARIREVRSERELELEVSVVGDPARARPARVRVRLRGPASAMAEITPEHIAVRALTSSRDEDGMAPLAVELAGGYRELEVVACEPDRVKLVSPGGS
jgi:hypothetical protein